MMPATSMPEPQPVNTGGMNLLDDILGGPVVQPQAAAA